MNHGMRLLRQDGRKKEQIRSVKVTRNFIEYAEGAVLMKFRVSFTELCTFCATWVSNSHGCAITGNPRSKPFSRKRGTWVWAAEG